MESSKIRHKNLKKPGDILIFCFILLKTRLKQFLITHSVCVFLTVSIYLKEQWRIHTCLSQSTFLRFRHFAKKGTVRDLHDKWSGATRYPVDINSI